MKSKYSSKKISNQNHVMNENTLTYELQEELKRAYEQLQHHKLSSELQYQKRILIQQQYHQIKDENLGLRSQIQKIKKDLLKLSKKYAKNKEVRQCEKCQLQMETFREVQRQREIFIKERMVLKNEIQQLKRSLELMENKSQVGRLESFIKNLKKQLHDKIQIIEQQGKVIHFLDSKLSKFELQNMKILANVQLVDERIQELEMENNILKGNQEKTYNSRVNGSIKNNQRHDKSIISRDSY